MSIEYKSVDFEDKQQIIDFLAPTLSHNLNTEIWNWEFESHSSPSINIAAFDQQIAIGTLSCIPVNLNVDGKTVLSGKQENGYVKEEYRGKSVFEGLFNKLSFDAKSNGYKILWGFTPAGIKVYRDKLNHEIFMDSMYKAKIRITKTIAEEKSIKQAIISLYFILFNFYQLVYIALTRHKRFLSKITTEHKLRKESEIFALHKDVQKNFDIRVHIEMNNEYINWRINENPNLDYIQQYFYVDNKLIGYYIISIKQATARIADIVFNEKKYAKYLMLHLIKTLKKKKIKNAFYLANKENMVSSSIFRLSRVFWGKVQEEKKMYFIFRHMSKSNIGYFNQPEKWLINGLWTEGFGI